MSVQVLDPGKRVPVNFHDYQLPGDNLAIVINLASNVVAGVMSDHDGITRPESLLQQELLQKAAAMEARAPRAGES